MRILVDEKDLKLLLEEKKNFIGKEVAIDSIISAFYYHLYLQNIKVILVYLEKYLNQYVL